MSDILPLNLLDSGASAEVIEVTGLPAQIQRARELGFHNGVQIDMVRSGSPCIVKLSGQTLCMRTNDMLNIFVRPDVVS